MSLIIVLRNTSNLAPISDYDYTVLVGDGTEARSTIIEQGQVLQHSRSNGWQALVDKMLQVSAIKGRE